MASFVRGASAQPPGEALAGLEGNGPDTRARSSPWHWSQAGQVLRAGSASLSAWQPAEGTWAASADPQAQRPSLPISWAAHLSEKSSDAVPPCQSHASLTGDKFLLVVLASLGTRQSSGHKGSFIPPCPPCSPTSYRHLGPWPRRGLEGSRRRTQPLRRRGSSAELPSLPPVDGSHQGPR